MDILYAKQMHRVAENVCDMIKLFPDYRMPGYVSLNKVTHAFICSARLALLTLNISRILPVLTGSLSQGSFCAGTQPMRDDVTVSLFGWAHIQNDPCLAATCMGIVSI